MSIETVCPGCGEEYCIRHPYCPVCRFSKAVGRVLTKEEAETAKREADEEEW